MADRDNVDIGVPSTGRAVEVGPFKFGPEQPASLKHIYLMVGYEQWQCLQGQYPRPVEQLARNAYPHGPGIRDKAFLYGTIYDVGARWADNQHKVEEAIKRIDSGEIASPDVLGPAAGFMTATNLLVDNKRIRVESFYLTQSRAKFRLAGITQVSPPASVNVAQYQSFDEFNPHLPDANHLTSYPWLGMAFLNSLQGTKVPPLSAFKVKTAGRIPHGRCTDDYIQQFNVAALYWIYGSFSRDQSPLSCS